jgi:hypothetical protein
VEGHVLDYFLNGGDEWFAIAVLVRVISFALLCAALLMAGA